MAARVAIAPVDDTDRPQVLATRSPRGSTRFRANAALLGDPANRHTPAWTRDGSALVFAYRGQLFRVGADGTALQALTSPAG